MELLSARGVLRVAHWLDNVVVYMNTRHSLLVQGAHRTP